MIFFGGFFLGGPQNLIVSAVATDLGQNRHVKLYAKSISVVTGIIDGTGCKFSSLL